MNLPPKTGQLAVAAIAASTVMLLGACGGSLSPDPNEGQPPDAPPAAPVGGPAPAGLTDPCALLGGADLTDIAGVPVRDGERNQEEDGTFVACYWYAEDDDLRIAGVVDLTLLVVNDEMKANIESDIISGKGDRLADVGQSTTVQSVDLGTTGNSYAAGWQGAAFYRLSCTTPPNGGRPSKEICTKAVTLLAQRLPAG
jgi:hypothetical protein